MKNFHKTVLFFKGWLPLGVSWPIYINVDSPNLYNSKGIFDNIKFPWNLKISLKSHAKKSCLEAMLKIFLFRNHGKKLYCSLKFEGRLS